MSQVIVIKSKLKIENLSLAKQALGDLGIENVHFDETGFHYQGYQYDDGISQKRIMKKLEDHYALLLQEFKKEKIIQNAKKHGYVVKKEIRKDKTIKLVLQKRVY